MSNALEAYLEHSRRIALLMAWLECELDRHERDAMKPEDARTLWPWAGSLEHVEELLRQAVCFLSDITEEEIKAALSGGGQGND